MFSKPTPTSSSVPPPGAAGSRRRSSHRRLRRLPLQRWLRSRCNARSPCDGSDRSATPPAGNGGLGGYGWEDISQEPTFLRRIGNALKITGIYGCFFPQRW